MGLALRRVSMPSASQVSDLAVVPEEKWSIARVRSEALRPLIGLQPLDAATVEKRAVECGVHKSTLYRWLQRYKENATMSSLLPKSPGSAKGSRRIADSADRIITEIIEGRYLTRQRLSISLVQRDIALRCREEGVGTPSESTLRRRIHEIPRAVELRRREGGHAAQTVEPLHGSFDGGDAPLSVIQIDHTPLDLILVDDIHRLPIGRAFLTLAIDVYSRMVAGFYIAFEEPSALSVGLCLAQAILPKDLWLSKIGITTPWPLHGFMQKVHCDNAREFRGNMLKMACEQYGIDIQFRRVRRPWDGGHIERLLGTFVKEIHALPGTTFSNPTERGAYKSAEKATLTLSEFELWLSTFIVEVYHQRVHRGIGTSPIQRFEQGMKTATRSCNDAHRLRLDFLPFERRSVQRYGIALDGIHYYSNVLRRWIDSRDTQNPKLRRMFIVRRDPRDISLVHFFDPETDCYFEIPYRDTSRPAMSLWELRAVKRKLEADGAGQIDEDLIFRAFKEMRKIEEKAGKQTLQARRRSSVSAVASPPLKSEIPKPANEEAGSNEMLEDIKCFEELEVG